ncbi:MAG: family N-acetyltransferase [Glaciihabitans sp.]|nr:family N-acetyltransferase [Glaciihabitans sp.]
MIDPAFFHDQPTLTTSQLRLEPLGPGHFDTALAARPDRESRRLTGTHVETTDDDVADRLHRASIADDRADWAIVRSHDGMYVGEVSLRDFDPYNESMDFHIELSNSAVFGMGFGSEATKAVVNYGLEVVHLHRITLRVVDYNTRAQRLYSKIGFHPEGLLRDAWFWDGEWSDVILMAIVSEH